MSDDSRENAGAAGVAADAGQVAGVAGVGGAADDLLFALVRHDAADAEFVGVRVTGPVVVGVMVKVSRQALDEVLAAINDLAIAAAQYSLGARTTLPEGSK